jgi:hypothetical protein
VRRFARQVGAFLIFAAACGAPTAPTVTRTASPSPARVVDDATWARLAAHPLTVPALVPGAACPKTATAELSPFTGPVAGPGPIYSSGNTLFYTRAEDGSLNAKVAWISRPDYTGPALVRGRRIDGSGDVRFAVGQGRPAPELRFEYETYVRAAGSEAGWRFLPSSVVAATGGCYAFQIDGVDWSIAVVMEMVPNP